MLSFFSSFISLINITCGAPASDYEEIDALFNKYDVQVNAAHLAKPKEGVRVLPFKEIKRREESVSSK